jgi:hypothetical protein
LVFLSAKKDVFTLIRRKLRQLWQDEKNQYLNIFSFLKEVSYPAGVDISPNYYFIGVHRFRPARRPPVVLRAGPPDLWRAGMARGFSVNPEPLNP